jgi:hypothetical protein
LHVSASDSLGVSTIRNEHLIAAVGPTDVLSGMFLGQGVQVHFPGENLAARFRKQRDSLRLGGSGASSDHPFVEIVVAGEARILPSGRPTIGPYEIFLQQSVRRDVLCVSIERQKVCPETAARHQIGLLSYCSKVKV